MNVTVKRKDKEEPKEFHNVEIVTALRRRIVLTWMSGTGVPEEKVIHLREIESYKVIDYGN